MSLAQLRVFEAIVASGSITAAARFLGITQPAVSAQLAALERARDVQLIDRRTGAPTEVGAALHEITRPLFELADVAERHLADAAHLGGEVFRIAADAPGYLMPLLAEARHDHPGARFEVTAGNSTAVIDAVRSRRADAGVAADVPDDPALHRIALRAQDLVAVVRTDHPRAGGKKLALADLAGERLIGRERGSVTRASLEEAAADAGVELSYGMVADTREAVLAAVAAGLGIGIVAEDEMLDDPRLVMLDLSDPVVTVTEYLVCVSGVERTSIWRTLEAVANAPRAYRDRPAG
ncbi:LysR family transcriptional regulator [Microbacterium sp. LTA6]|uniref:LysR family transcriptional regulator n=1 Tax=unclassified Microbacterium TaxID=2609290 RepID=UPI003138D253